MRSLILPVLSLLALDLGATAVAPSTGLSLTRTAAAADFTGKIKRIRIKQRRVGSSYRIAAETTGATTGTTVEATLTDKATGLPIGSWTLGTPVRGAVVASGDVGGIDLGDEVTLAIEGDWSRVGDLCVLSGLARGRASGASSNGWKASATETASGELKVTVRNEDKDWSGGNLTGVTVWSEDGTTGVALELQGIGQDRETTVDADLSAYGEVELTATLTDADGVVVDALTETVDLGGGLSDTDPSLALATIEKSPKGLAQVSTCTLAGDGKASLEVDLVDDETGKSVVMTTDDTPVRTVQALRSDLVAFDKDPAGYRYVVSVQPTNADGKAVDGPFKVELTVPKYDGGDVVYDAVPLTKGTAELGFARGSDGIAVIALRSDELGGTGAWAGVDIRFEEPFEGPMPLETDVVAEAGDSFQEWLQVGEGAVPDSWTLTQALATPEGALIQSTTVSGAGTGEAYRTGDKGDLGSDTTVLTVHVCHL